MIIIFVYIVLGIQSFFPGSELMSPKTTIATVSCLRVKFHPGQYDLSDGSLTLTIKLQDATSMDIKREYKTPVFALKQMQVVQLEVGPYGPYESDVITVIVVDDDKGVGSAMGVIIDEIKLSEGTCDRLGRLSSFQY